MSTSDSRHLIYIIYICTDKTRTIIKKIAYPSGECPALVGEILAIRTASQLRLSKIIVESDSQMAIRSILGKFQFRYKLETW